MLFQHLSVSSWWYYVPMNTRRAGINAHAAWHHTDVLLSSLEFFDCFGFNFKQYIVLVLNRLWNILIHKAKQLFTSVRNDSLFCSLGAEHFKQLESAIISMADYGYFRYHIFTTQGECLEVRIWSFGSTVQLFVT